MKTDHKIITTLSATLLLALTALGQDSLNQPMDETTPNHQDLIQFRGEGWNGAAKATDVIGMRVDNLQGEKLGKVSDLAMDMESGRVVEVIISGGGFLGMGKTLTAVPPGAFQSDAALRVLKLDTSKEKFNAAPRFDVTKWNEGTQSNRLSEIHDANRSRTWGKLGSIETASKLMGAPVKNLQEENLGKVVNFAVDLPAGRIVAVIISTGGFMGMDNELSAVPPTTLQFNAEPGSLQLDASRDALVNSPHFKASEWPDLTQSDYFGGVYRAYNTEPYFTTGADNTRRNVRDRDSRTLTPLDQGNNQADVDTTAQIRKGIMADSGLSINAENVKIITLNGHVTLRGPVNTAEEKSRIAEIANRVANAGNVDNQLEVSTTPNNN
jgi:hyperosmotically inducible protein